VLDSIPFCTDWSDVVAKPRDVKNAYVARELRRLDAEGAPILRAALATLDDELLQVVLDLLHGTADTSDDEPLFPDGPRAAWRLRLRKGAVPPPLDPQGRPVPPADRGKLIVKVGNLGGRLGPEARQQELARYNGDARQVASLAGRDLYRNVKIGTQPTALSLGDALTVLRQWGYGCTLRRYQRVPAEVLAEWKRRGEDPDKKPQGQDLWLVEEVPTPERAEAAPQKGKAA
jgi:hypothetical protein